MRELHTIWNVYNELRDKRDEVRALRATLERSRSWDEGLIGHVHGDEKWLTQMLAAIDHGQGMPSEDEA